MRACHSYRQLTISQIRCVFRMVEFAEGNDGYTLRHEWIFWVFEALLMIFALLVFCVWFPSKYIGNAGASIRKKKSETEAAGNSSIT